MAETGFFAAIAQALAEADPDCKTRQVFALQQSAWQPDVATAAPAAMPGFVKPGRPAKPVLVAPRKLHKRGLQSLPGRCAFVHAIAHIEFNAINLALDAAWRFRGMPADFYRDWLAVAGDEARHYGWLSQRLQQLGHTYGDFPAHNGLWEAARKTSHDPLARMALVPRVLEARGLDVTPDMIARLRQHGDQDTAAILEKILEEEVAHVAIGTRWFEYLCRQRGLERAATFATLLNQHMPNMPRTVLNIPARQRSGFSAAELEFLQSAQRQG